MFKRFVDAVDGYIPSSSDQIALATTDSISYTTSVLPFFSEVSMGLSSTSHHLHLS